MAAISNRLPGIVVIYDSGKGRIEKTFTDAYAARRFYVKKFNAGCNPKLKKVN